MNPYTQHLKDGMREILGVPDYLPFIAKPDPIAALESAEGMCGLPECGCVDGCVMGGEVCDG